MAGGSFAKRMLIVRDLGGVDVRAKVELFIKVQRHVFRVQRVYESSYIQYSPFYENVKKVL